jgi:hypothetical protein
MRTHTHVTQHTSAYVSIRQSSIYMKTACGRTDTSARANTHTERTCHVSDVPRALRVLEGIECLFERGVGGRNTRHHHRAAVSPEAVLEHACELALAIRHLLIRQHASAYVCIRQEHACELALAIRHLLIRQHTPAYASIRQHTSARQELAPAIRHLCASC